MISYCITVCNEKEEVNKLLSQLIDLPFIGNQQIVVQYDIENATRDVLETVEYIKDKNKCEFVITGYPLNNNFANYKNNLFNYATHDWIFQVDADEYLANNLANNLPELLTEYNDLDLIKLSRINIVNGITEQHLVKWGWRLFDSEFGKCVNWPDLQNRIYKNKPGIKWINPVHEVITGYKYSSDLVDPTWSLIHIKDIIKQETQNEFYQRNF